MPGLRHVLPLVLVAGAAHAVEVDGAARLWLSGGLDTNVHRDYVVLGGETKLAGLIQGLVELDGQLRGERGSLRLSYDAGGRLVPLGPAHPEEHFFVQNALFEGELYLLPELSLGATLYGRDRRGADRDYTDLHADGFIRLLVQGRLDAKVSVGAHRFLYWPRFRHSFWGPDFGLVARMRLTKRHSVVASLGYEPRTFNSTALRDPDLDPPPDPAEEPPRRLDSYFTVSAGYQYRGPWAFGFSYSFTESDSNSFAETFRRHRLSLNAGVKLFWELTLMGSLGVVFAQYPEGVYLEDDADPSAPLIATYDDENLNQLSVKLARPLGRWFELDLRYQLFFNWLAPSNISQPRADEYLWYVRHVVSLGVSFRIDSY